jgi:8-oxo-dGTP pyrophosphatase MutT (NUDIX family)
MATFDLLAAGDARLLPSGELDQARRSVARASLRGDEQEATRRRLLAFVDEHPDALERTCRPGHLTGSALVIDPSTGAVLVLFHRKLQRWLQPGGHADGDGHLAHVAWREATEETGIAGLAVVVPAIHLDVHEVRPPAEDPHLHLDVRYLVLAPAGAPAAGNHESEALRWVAPGELHALGADDGLVALAARAAEVLADLGRTGGPPPSVP